MRIFLKSSKFHIKCIGTELLNFKKMRINHNSMFCTDFRFLTGKNFPLFEKLPLKVSTYVLKIERKTHVRPRIPTIFHKPIHKSKEKEMLHISLIESLQKCKSVEEQIQIFQPVVQLADENINCRISICQDLEKILQPYFPSCFVRLIGSSVNGLGFKGCDVDLSIQFPNESVNEKQFREKKWLNEEVREKGFSPKHRLMTIRQILLSSNYGETLTVIPGRCPILNFTIHDMPCDLAVSNRAALHSTNLMLLSRKLDERVTPFLQIVIYWGKCNSLVGGYGKFKTYAMFLMVLYFLQTRNPPVLPPVEAMFEKTDFLKNLDNWSYDVTTYVTQFEKSSNNQTVEELLKEFFTFYRSFNFSEIICPISSSSVDPKSFAEKVDCKNSFEMNTISIQDPFEHSFNVTTGVTWKNCKIFKKAINSAWENCQDQNRWIPGLENWGIASLFDKHVK